MDERGRSRITIAVTALTALPVLIVLDTLVAVGRGWFLRTGAEWAVLTLCGAWILPVWGLLQWSRTRRWVRRHWDGLTVLGITLTLMVLLVEVGLSMALGPATLWYHLREPNERYEMHPRADVMPGVDAATTFTTNAKGMRGPEMPRSPDVYRILCLGGSTTACLYLDDSDAWPQRVMTALNGSLPERPVWVANVGRSGYATAEHIDYLRGSHVLSEVDCLVCYVGANDHQRAIRGRSLRCAAAHAPVWMRSHLLHAAFRLVAVVRARREGRIETRDGAAYPRRRAARRRRPRVAHPDVSDALNEYAHNISEIIAMCRDHAVRPVFVTQAVLWRGGLSAEEDALLWMGSTPGGHPSAAQLRDGLDRFNTTLIAVCRDQDVEVVDASVLSGQAEYYYDDMHFNRAGSHALAAIVARHLASQPR